MAKRTNKRESYSSTKQVIKNDTYSSDNEKIAWCFDMIDRSGKFAFDLSREDFKLYDVMEKIVDYGSMTWSEVKKQTHDKGKSKHHTLAIESLSHEALERFKVRCLDDYSDSLFSFAFQNKLRIIGIRDKAFFRVLWYDPEHEVCPSTKKNS